MILGRVIGLVGGVYEVLTLDKTKYLCKARGKLRSVKVDKNSDFNYTMNKNSKKLETNTIKMSPKVGDFVHFNLEQNQGYIMEILPRKNEMIRPDIANVDQIMLVFAAKTPDFSTLLLDMFLISIEQKMIKPLIIVSKIDLLTNIELDELNKKIEYYRSIGYEIICVNSKTKENIELILPYLENKITVLAGQTGAGKSTLINALIPGFDLKTQEISMALGRGKHTTREIKLYEFNSALIGDTPGFSKFDIMDIKPCDLSKYYIEFKAYDCKFNDCLHKPNILGCNVTKALNDGKILKERYENYLKILNDISSDRKR